MQLADSLTKTGSQDRMRSFLQNGQRWSLAYDPNFVAARKLRAAAGAGKTPDLDARVADCSWLDILNHGSDQRGMSDLQLQVSKHSYFLVRNMFQMSVNIHAVSWFHRGPFGQAHS